MKYVFYGLIVIALGFGGFLLFGSINNSNTVEKDATAVKVAGGNEVLKFSTSITNRSYFPKQVDVPLGATVEITVKNNDNEQHGLSIPDFGVNDFVAPLSTKTIRFVANKKGEAATFCSVNHPEKLIVNVI
jgi:heme/copper-type cytochrome/quinol oxidase subunit 2